MSDVGPTSEDEDTISKVAWYIAQEKTPEKLDELLAAVEAEGDDDHLVCILRRAVELQTDEQMFNESLALTGSLRPEQIYDRRPNGAEMADLIDHSAIENMSDPGDLEW